MQRSKLVLGLVAVVVAMMVAFAAPAMAADNDRHENRVDHRLDNRLDRLDDRFGLNGESFFVSDIDFGPLFVTDKGLADELCSPLSFEAINDAIPGCIFGNHNDDLDVDYYGYYPYWGSSVDFDIGIDRGIGWADGFDRWDNGVDIDFDQGTHFAEGSNRHSDDHGGGGASKGHGK
ncbi:MAG: hypothetical protein LC740_08160 [Actinobacteria bacterium]|nr:hypothetical protein [Actinomycetota bacterium]